MVSEMCHSILRKLQYTCKKVNCSIAVAIVTVLSNKNVSFLPYNIMYSYVCTTVEM